MKMTDEESELSETLQRRRNVFRRMLGGFAARIKNAMAIRGGEEGRGNRWSDCGCESCVSWMKGNDGTTDLRLHFVVRESSTGIDFILSFFFNICSCLSYVTNLCLLLTAFNW